MRDPKPAVGNTSTDPINNDQNAAANGGNKPICLISSGRGNRGKTHLKRYFAEAALNAGRPVILADGDCTNRTLSGYFPEQTISPPSAHPAAVRQWFEGAVEMAASKQSSLILDFGAGDQTIRSIAQELELETTIGAAGLQPVALCCAGADPDDLAAILAARKSYAPAETIFAFTPFTLPAHLNPTTVLEELGARNAALHQMLEDGAELVTIPTLSCTHKLTERRLRFDDAENGLGKTPLSLFDRQRVAMWRRAMQEAFQPLCMWLP